MHKEMGREEGADWQEIPLWFQTKPDHVGSCLSGRVVMWFSRHNNLHDSSLLEQGDTCSLLACWNTCRLHRWRECLPLKTRTYHIHVHVYTCTDTHTHTEHSLKVSFIFFANSSSSSHWSLGVTLKDTEMGTRWSFNGTTCHKSSFEISFIVSFFSFGSET